MTLTLILLALFLVLALAKLSGVVKWAWWKVTIPLWVVALKYLWLLVLIVAALAAVYFGLFDAADRRRITRWMKGRVRL